MTYSAEEVAAFLADAAADELVTLEERRRFDLRIRRRYGCYPFAPVWRFKTMRPAKVVVTSNIPVLKDILNFERDLLLPHVAQLLCGLYSVNDG